MTHTIKLLEDFEEAVFKGEKTFEVRLNDRAYQKGDIVVFNTIHRSTLLPKIQDSLAGIKFRITYVLSGFGIQEGYVVFSFERMKGEEDA